MAQQHIRPVIDTVDPVWTRIRREADEIVRREPEIASFIYSTVLNHDTLEAAHHPAHCRPARSPGRCRANYIRAAYSDAVDEMPGLGDIFRADIAAVFDRDPATNRYHRADPLLQGLPRHPDPSCWRTGCTARPAKDFAYYLQSRSSAVFQCDIHPAVAHRPRHLPRSRDRLRDG